MLRRHQFEDPARPAVEEFTRREMRNGLIDVLLNDVVRIGLPDFLHTTLLPWLVEVLGL